MIEDQHIDPLAAGLRALLPPGYAKTVGFLIPARAMTQQLIDWYENEHSVYASFMWPHMRRYQRNYIVDVRRGPSPLYKVISEFCWKDEEQKRMIISHFSTEVAARTLNEVLPEFVIVPFPEGGYFLAPVDERQVATGKRVLRHDEPRRRKIILLRRGDGVEASSFEASAADYARQLAGELPDVDVGVDFRRESATVPAPADAVLFIDAEPNQFLPEPEAEAIEIASIFDVLTLRSPIKED